MADQQHQAFSILAREHSGMLLTYLRSLVYDQDAVEDLFQECWIIAWKKLDEFDHERSFAKWLRGIARNLVMAHYRKVKKSPVLLTEQILTHMENKMATMDLYRDDDSDPSKLDSYDSYDSWDDRVDELKACLHRLADEARLVIEKHYQQNQSTEEIANSMGLNRETVKKRLQRTRAALAKCLENRGLLPT